MPSAKIPVVRFRECQMGATEADFLHHFAAALVGRGFRIGKDRRGRWLPDPPLVYDRDSDPEHLLVSQTVPGRVDAKHPTVAALLHQIRHGSAGAIGQLHAFLLAEGDDRAKTLEALGADAPENVLVIDDFGGQTGAPGQPPEGNLVASETIAARQLAGKILVLLGAADGGTL